MLDAAGLVKADPAAGAAAAGADPDKVLVGVEPCEVVQCQWYALLHSPSLKAAEVVPRGPVLMPAHLFHGVERDFKEHGRGCGWEGTGIGMGKAVCHPGT